VVEPARLVDQQVDAVTYRFTYADIPHHAEGIIAEPGRAKVWVVSKQLAAGTVWQVPLSTARVTRAVAVGDIGGLMTDAAMSRDGTHYVIRDYLRAYLYDAPVSASSLARAPRIELPFEPQGEAVTFAPGDRALLVAGERDTALWWVPLAASRSATRRPRHRRRRRSHRPGLGRRPSPRPRQQVRQTARRPVPVRSGWGSRSWLSSLPWWSWWRRRGGCAPDHTGQRRGSRHIVTASGPPGIRTTPWGAKP
jgi:hypothetical protein